MILRPVVEGHGDALAVPDLIRRILQDRYERYDVRVLPGFRIPRGRLGGGSADWLLQAVAAADPVPDRLLVVFDSDDDCPVGLAQSYRGNPLMAVAIAVREFEAWILANSSDPAIFGKAETVRDAKGLVSQTVMPDYAERRNATRLVHTLDLDRVERNSRSFRHLVKVVRELVDADIVTAV